MAENYVKLTGIHFLQVTTSVEAAFQEHLAERAKTYLDDPYWTDGKNKYLHYYISMLNPSILVCVAAPTPLNDSAAQGLALWPYKHWCEIVCPNVLVGNTEPRDTGVPYLTLVKDK